MGNGLAAGPGGIESDVREVTLCLHSVHNVQHSPSESYYGMATSSPSDSEIPVTSERPAQLTASLETIISVRIFLHERGTSSSTDRVVGHLSIPVREVVAMCGPAIYQTWLLLEVSGVSDCGPYSGASSMPRSRVAERFKHALHGISADLHAPRVCLTLTPSTTDTTGWLTDQAAQSEYYNALLISHAQHLQATRAYFNLVGRMERSGDSLQTSINSSSRGAPVEPANLRAELERLHQRQREEEANQQATQLQAELDQITDEANRRIEKGNDAILKLKAQFKDLRDTEMPRLHQEREEAERRVEAAKRRNVELKGRVESFNAAPASEDHQQELEQLEQQVAVLANQKALLMTMVEETYGSAAAAEAGQLQSEAATPVHDNVLPDVSEILGDKPRPL